MVIEVDLEILPVAFAAVMGAVEASSWAGEVSERPLAASRVVLVVEELAVATAEEESSSVEPEFPSEHSVEVGVARLVGATVEEE